MRYISRRSSRLFAVPALAAALAVGSGQAGAVDSASSTAAQQSGHPFSSSVDAELGINDPASVPAGPIAEPVVLIHGTTDDASSWETAIAVLQQQGACVWAFDFGGDDVSLPAFVGSKGVADIRVSAPEVASQIDYVRAATGAAKVNLVGYSQGALLAKLYQQVHGSPENVARVINIGGNVHGTTLGGIAGFLNFIAGAAPSMLSFFAGTSTLQQVRGSEIINEANKYPDTVAGISYTSIFSPGDTTVTPSDASRLVAVPGADVVNLDVGEACGISPAHHKLIQDPTVIGQLIWGLTRAEGAQPDPSTCLVSAAELGSADSAGSSVG